MLLKGKIPETRREGFPGYLIAFFHFGNECGNSSIQCFIDLFISPVILRNDGTQCFGELQPEVLQGSIQLCSVFLRGSSVLYAVSFEVVLNVVGQLVQQLIQLVELLSYISS